MKFTLSWLKEHLDTTASLEEVLDALVKIGLEVEGVEDPRAKLAGIIVAHVDHREKHPDADRLSVCRVDDGSGQILQIVCGATNVRAGMKVALARPGVVIPATGDALKKGSIRGIESQGMLCSAEELLLDGDSNGIMDLVTDLSPGSDLATALGETDPVIDISITPNRGDCFGIRGIARDLAAFGLGTLKPLIEYPISEKSNASIAIRIDDQSACPYFAARLVQGIKNCPSPEWLQRRMKAVGLKIISAPVDITNYMAYDLGRPMHVFDADKISGALHVRQAQTCEKLQALNEIEYTLDHTITVVADNTSALGVAGIIGGQSSSCQMETVNILIESAIFDAVSIAKTGQKLNVYTDSRARFERGVDPSLIDYALDKAAHMLVEFCGGTIAGKSHAGTVPHNNVVVTLTHQKLQALSGYPYTLDMAASFLEKLGCVVITQTSDVLTVSTPSHRHDLQIEEDLIEEVIRLHGYDNIPITPLPSVIPVDTINVRHITRNALIQRGLDEVLTFSMIAEDIAKLFGERLINIKQPLNADLKTLRPSLIPSLIQATRNNALKSIKNTAFFEIAPVFYGLSDAVCNQHQSVGIVRCQKHHDKHWNSTAREVDAFDAKADGLALLEHLGLAESSIQIDTSVPDYFHPHRAGRFKLGNKTIGYFGNIHPKVLKALDIDYTVVAVEINIEQLPPLNKKKPKPLTLSSLQPISRDFSFVVDTTVTADTLVRAIKKADQKYLQAVNIFDVYQGEKLDTGKKSIAVEVIFQQLDKTLVDAEIQDLSARVIANVEKHCGGILRA